MLPVVSTVVLVLMLCMLLAVTGCGDDDPDRKVTSLTIGWNPWDEGIAISFLWRRILADRGYQVKMMMLDIAPIYAGLARGDLELYFNAWLPVTHEDYWEEYGPRIEDLCVYFTEGTLELTVPAYVEEVNSIEDLPGNSDLFDGTIVGIEPGTGLMRVVLEDIMPGYSLEDEYEVIETSTTTMLAELARAVGKKQPIVVTLWHPQWAYSVYDLKDLEDPKGLFGASENFHVLGREGFRETYPEIAGWISNFRMTDKQMADLVALVVEEYGIGREDEAITFWLEDPENQALLESWLAP